MSTPMQTIRRPAPPAQTSEPLSIPAAQSVIVVAEGDIFDAALVALVERTGYRAVAAEPDRLTAVPTTTALLIRSPQTLARIRRSQVLRGVRVVYVGDGVPTGDRFRVAPSAPHAEKALGGALAAAIGPPVRHSAPVNRVRITDREREILQTHTRGATLRETSRIHQIAESTVREHYRRVSRRYEEAGRPIGNKTQLLLEFIADGWVRP